MIRFEWDPVKAANNLRKHGVSFETAMRVFADPLRMTEIHQVVDGEFRWRCIGNVGLHMIVVVAHTTNEDSSNGEVVRIISARRATHTERTRYEEETG